eukprot:tig00020684_g12871.t1
MAPPAGLDAKLALAERTRTINAPYSSLRAFPKEVLSITTLTRLDLGHNLIPSLPASISKLVKLEELYLNSNMLTLVPPELALCKKLKILDLSDNRIVELPTELGGLRDSLLELHLASNPLSTELAAILDSSPAGWRVLLEYLSRLDERRAQGAELGEKLAKMELYREERLGFVPRLVAEVLEEFKDPNEVWSLIRNAESILPLPGGDALPATKARTLQRTCERTFAATWKLSSRSTSRASPEQASPEPAPEPDAPEPEPAAPEPAEEPPAPPPADPSPEPPPSKPSSAGTKKGTKKVSI